MSPNRTTCFLSQEEFDRIKATYAKFNEPWQSAETEVLKAMASDGVSLESMATQLQRTPGAIKMKLKSLGLYTPGPAPKPWTEEDEACP